MDFIRTIFIRTIFIMTISILVITSHVVSSFRPKAIVIHITIEFRDLTTVPSEDEVLTTIDAEWNIKKARELGKQIPDNAVSIQCISYESKFLAYNVIKKKIHIPAT